MTPSPPPRSIRSDRPRLAALALLSLLLASCGSTRYVVVDGGGAAAAAAPATTAPAGPTSAEDEEAIRAALEVALSLEQDVEFAQRQEFLVDADDIEPTFRSVAELVKDLDVELHVDAVTVSGDAGTATVSVRVDGEAFAEGVPVEVVRDDGAWKVTRGGACAALAIGSPCPEI